MKRKIYILFILNYSQFVTRLEPTITASPHLTRILRPEKNRVRRNRTIGGLWDYTMQKF